MQDDKKRLKIVDESLTPEEEQAIEVRVDKMMQVAPATEDEPEPEATPPPEPAKQEPTAPELPAAETIPEAAEPTKPEPEPVAPAEPEPTTPEPAPALSPEDEELARLAEDPVLAEDKPSKEDTHVDELAAKEHTAELEKKDAEVAAAFTPPPQKKHRLRRFFAGWWHNKLARWATIVVLLLALAGAGVWPVSRAWALNLVGMRATATVTVFDATTNLPLKNVTVHVGSAAANTDQSGDANLTGVKLGKQALTVQRSAFAVTSKTVTIALGTNRLGTVELKPAGDQYRIKVINYVTGKPLASAQATSGVANAIADKDGLIVLTADAPKGTLAITVSAPGYRSQTLTAPQGGGAQQLVQLAVDRSEVFFSNQSGTYDLYKSDINGQNRKLLLAGTGKEDGNLVVVPHPTAEEAAIVDTRDGNKDNAGYVLQSLNLINVSTGAPTSIDHSERIIIIDWVGDRLVYAMVKAGASAANPSRYQLMSYDYRTNQRLELDHANAFNDVVSTGGSIYYATSNQYNGGTSQFVKINPDATGKQVLLNAEVWNILRKDYSNFFLATGSDSYTYKLGDTKPAPTKDSYSGGSRLYIDASDGKHSLWVDQRDGKGTLMVYDIAKQTDTVLAQQPGITYPIRWLTNDTVEYRVKTDTETADYVIGLGTNTAKKITDVTNAAGRSLWFFY